MKRCQKCNKEFEEEYLFCPYCGTKYCKKIKCPNCQKEIDQNSSFCGFCGAKITKEKVVKNDNISSIFDLIKKISLLVLVCFAMIFFFLPIINNNSFYLQTKNISLLSFLNSSFFNQLSYLFDLLKNEKQNIVNSSIPTLIIYLTSAIVCYIGAIIAITFGIISIIKITNSLINKSKINTTIPAIAIGSYFISSICLFFVAGGKNTSLNISIGNFSLVFIIFLIVTLLISVTIIILDLINNKPVFNSKKIASLVIKTINLVLTLIIPFILIGGIYYLSDSSIEYYVSEPILMISLFELLNQGISSPTTLYVILYYFIMVIIVLILCNFTASLRNFNKKFSIFNFILSIIQFISILVLFIIMISNQIDNVSLSSNFYFIIILNIINLGLNISTFTLSKISTK